jgi:hypothetical protein
LDEIIEAALVLEGAPAARNHLSTYWSGGYEVQIGRGYEKLRVARYEKLGGHLPDENRTTL